MILLMSFENVYTKSNGEKNIQNQLKVKTQNL